MINWFLTFAVLLPALAGRAIVEYWWFCLQMYDFFPEKNIFLAEYSSGQPYQNHKAAICFRYRPIRTEHIPVFAKTTIILSYSFVYCCRPIYYGMIGAVFNYHSSITTIMVKNDNILCINCTIKTETVREQVQNMLKRLLFSSRQAFLLSKTAFKAAWDPGVSSMETRVRERCRPGSARDLYGGAEMFICRVGGTFIPCFCIFFAEGYFCSYKHK